ncbi:MAG: amidohydrolase family protein [Erysipelotrichaceae bacterium]|nr:amidohydrolase family protein [Erysipelotrichaceae bacterium]
MKYAFVNGILLDGTKDMAPAAGKTVLVENGKIKDILDGSEAPAGYETVDLSGAYLLPGLIDLHVHIAIDGKPPKADKKPPNYKLLFQVLSKSRIVLSVVKRRSAEYARTELMSGVTTIRTVGGILDIDGKIRDEINAGKLVGPRILAANTGVSVPGGHFAGSIATEAATPEEARQHVRQIIRTNPDLIKLMITGGVMDSSEEGEPGVLRMSPEIVKAACEEAHTFGYKVAAHVESPEGVRVALENGVDTVEHGAKLDEEMIRLFKERGASPVCTISPALPYAEFELSESHALPVAKKNGKIVMDGIIECAKACIENDIPVGLGNDVGCPFILHYNYWRELCYFHKYVGVSNKDTLYTATLGNAKIAGIDSETGSIEKGKSADMIVVKGNPLEDLSVLRNVSAVMIKGRLIRDPQFRRMQEVDDLLDKYM